MELSNFMDILTNNGVAIVVVIYFLWKDSKLTKENTAILEEVKTLLLLLTNKEGVK